MSSTLSPNMNLPVPGVGNEPGPTYATDINTSLGIIDQHTHSSGSGVQIQPGGLDINSALTFQNNFATHVAGLTLTAQGSTPAINTIYESGNDLYFVDGLGNNVRITQSGGIAGSPGSIANLASPASASYVSGSQTFVWQSDTSIAANMDAGSLLLRNLSPNSTYALTLAPPASLAANYTLTLPALPASNSFMQMSTSGVMSASVAVSGGITSSNIAAGAVGETQLGALAVTAAKIAAQTITSAQIASATITGTQIATASINKTNMVAVGQVISSSSGAFSTGGSSYTQITNLQSTILTTGRPVRVALQSDGTTPTSTSTSGSFGVETNGTINATAQFAIFRNSTLVANASININTSTSNVYLPAGSLCFLDTPSAANYTYSCQVKVSAGGSAVCYYCVLVAYEL